MEELWKNIEGYDHYQISNYGRVKSLDRIDCLGRLKKGKVLKPLRNSGGYLQVCIFKNGIQKRCMIHRLVAMAFLDNPDNLPFINHKDENKLNNRVDNLEWCDRKYNNTYGSRITRTVNKTRNGKCSKTVYQYTLDGELVAEWPSTMEVQRKLRFPQSSISQCCNGKLKTANGYIWKYE